MATRTGWPDASTLRRQARSLELSVQLIIDYLRDIPPLPSVVRVGADGAIELSKAALVTVFLDASSGPLTVTLGAGKYDGQRVSLIAVSGAHPATVELTATDAIGNALTEIHLSHVAAGAEFVWDEVGGRWLPLGVSFG